MVTDRCSTSIDVLGNYQLEQQKFQAVATLPYTILSLLNFTVQVLVAVVGWKFQSDTVSVFQAHPTTIKVTVASHLAFVMAYGIDQLGFHTYHYSSSSSSWSDALLRTITLSSALLLVVSLASLVYPNALPSLGRRCLWVGERIFMNKLHALTTRISRTPPVPPLSNIDKGHTVAITIMDADTTPQ